MCGISGWFDTRSERPPNKGIVKAMNDAIRHRGPDGEGFHFAPGIAFGHRRLAIIDLVTGAQPMFDETGNLCLTFNGEIFNYRELRKELQEKQHHFRTSSDTEVILHAWMEWGRRLCESPLGAIRLRAVGCERPHPVPCARPDG